MKNAILVLENNTPKILESKPITTETGFDEAWLQDVIYKNPSILLNNELFDDDEKIIPIGTEIPIATLLGTNYMDILLVTNKGRIVIVETKLGKNREIHREVIAQVINYAKCINQWTVVDFEDCLKTNLQKNGKIESEIEIDQYMNKNNGVEYYDLLDKVSRCLKHGTFLLLVVGDKLSPNLILMRDAVRGAENLEFQIGLMEMQIYQNNNEIIISPDVVGRTVEEIRTIIKIKYEGKMPDIDIVSEIVDPVQENTQRGNTTEVLFLNEIPMDLRDVYTEYLKIWESNKDVTVSWGKLGFTVRLLEKGKKITILECYPGYFKWNLLIEVGQFENYENGYSVFVDKIKQNNILSNFYPAQKIVEIKYTKYRIDAVTLNDAFQATDDFINYLLKR